MNESTSQIIARAHALLDVHRCEDAITLLGSALARDSQSYELLVTLARALFMAGRNSDALVAAQRAAEVDPSGAEPHCIRAEVLLADEKRVLDADAAARKACALAPWSAYAHFTRVRTALAANHLEVAAQAAQSVSMLVPDSALGYHGRGLVALARKDWHGAEREYRAALAIVPDDPNLLNNCGLALLELGRNAEAMELFSRAGELDPRRSLFRENTAAAAVRHVLGWDRRVGPAQIVAVGMGAAALVAIATFLPGGTVAAAALVLVGLPVLIVRGVVRHRRLPPAARLALKIRESSGGAFVSRRERSRRSKIVRVVVSVAVIVILGAVNLIWSSPPSPSRTDFDWRCVKESLERQLSGVPPGSTICAPPTSRRP